MAGENTPETSPGPEPERGAGQGISRKNVLRAALAAGPAALLLGGAAATAAPTLARHQAGTDTPLVPTPYCDDGDDPTPPQMEGPYFKPNSPQRTSIRQPGDSSGLLTLSGYVFGLACQPLGRVLLDFWQADARGAYDNVTYRYRGHQYTDANGAYDLASIFPGLYPGRTRHIHVKVQAPGRPILTTQLYFPGEPRNGTDTIYDPRLLMNVRTVGGTRQCTFDFVLNVPGDPSDPADPADPSDPTDPTDPGGSWAPGVAYRVDDRVTYGGAGYRCRIAHTSMTGWEPPNTPALWQRQ